MHSVQCPPRLVPAQSSLSAPDAVALPEGFKPVAAVSTGFSGGCGGGATARHMGPPKGPAVRAPAVPQPVTPAAGSPPVIPVPLSQSPSRALIPKLLATVRVPAAQSMQDGGCEGEVQAPIGATLGARCEADVADSVIANGSEVVDPEVRSSSASLSSGSSCVSVGEAGDKGCRSCESRSDCDSPEVKRLGAAEAKCVALAAERMPGRRRLPLHGVTEPGGQKRARQGSHEDDGAAQGCDGRAEDVSSSGAACTTGPGSAGECPWKRAPRRAYEGEEDVVGWRPKPVDCGALQTVSPAKVLSLLLKQLPAVDKPSPAAMRAMGRSILEAMGEAHGSSAAGLNESIITQHVRLHYRHARYRVRRGKCTEERNGQSSAKKQ